MNQDKMYLINKLFNDKTIRTVWDKEKEKYFISIVDLVGALSESVRPRKYWSDIKKRLIEEGHNELSEKIGQLKLKSSDGKYYMTDVCDINEMFRIIESIPSKKAEPIKQWLAKLGKERVDEEYDPEITINRALQTYKRKGYSDDWINQRLKTIDARKEFTDELKNKGIENSKDFAILTDMLTKIWSGYSVKEYKQLKNLKKENLRDNMTNMELVLNMLAEVTSTEISKNSNEFGYKDTLNSVKRADALLLILENRLKKKLVKRLLLIVIIKILNRLSKMTCLTRTNMPLRKYCSS